jgi:hypothetical protein
MGDELRVVHDELASRGWTFWGWRPTTDGRGEFVAEGSNGAIAMSSTAVGLLITIQQLEGERKWPTGLR